MGKLAIKRKRRAKKHLNAGRKPRPVGGSPGAGDKVAQFAGAAGAVGGALGKQLLSHFTGIDLGELGAAAGVHPAAMAGMLGRRRRMRVTNVKALRRAIRRVEGFGRIAKKVIRFTHPHQRGRMAFKTRKRRRVA